MNERRFYIDYKRRNILQSLHHLFTKHTWEREYAEYRAVMPGEPGYESAPFEERFIVVDKTYATSKI